MFCMMFAQDMHKLTDFGVVINIFCKKINAGHFNSLTRICAGSLGTVKELFSVNSVATL